jgi:quercetin dioxygenase-like cupin family protein
MSHVRPQRSRHPAAGLALALLLASSAAVAETVPSPPLAAEKHAEQRLVLSTGTTVTDEPIRYPSGAPAHVTAVEITLQPGEQTGWHMHPVPMFGYILDGELTVDYGPKGQRTYRKGDGLMEAMNEAHNGRNSGPGPLKILAVVIGAEGVQGSVAASAPARAQ